MKVVVGRQVITQKDTTKISPFGIKDLERLKYMGEKGLYAAAKEFEAILAREIVKGMFSGQRRGWMSFYNDLKVEILSRQIDFGLAEYIVKAIKQNY